MSPPWAKPVHSTSSTPTERCAGTLWYIRRIAVDRVNNEIARREAEDLGLNNPDYWLTARSYLERLDNLRSQALDATGPVSAPRSRQKPRNRRLNPSDRRHLTRAHRACSRVVSRPFHGSPRGF